MTAEASPKVTVAVECWYEYAATVREAIRAGLRRIDRSDDPRWEGELREPPFRGDPRGYLQVAEVTRVDGEAVRKRGICGYAFHMNRAREFMRLFEEAVKAGASKPWDVEHFHRDLREEAKKAQEEGRVRELEMFRDAFLQAVAPVRAASSGSPVIRASDKVSS